jgi:beta-lysine 5,6-aminomutase beta subunit
MIVKPYGDTMDDGAVQLSFTLPVTYSPAAQEAARLLVLKLGFGTCEIVSAQPMADGFTMFVAYGHTAVGVDMEEIRVDTHGAEKYLSFDEINDAIGREIGGKLVVVGACTGSDAHTIGIDAIMNMKGYDHHYGLERYPMIEAHNLGAQVPNEELIARAVEVGADAILVSQVVTQKDVHIRNLTNFIELLEAEGLRERFIAIAGGPRISHRLAIELGFDAGFGRGTYPEHVATFIVNRLTGRK